MDWQITTTAIATVLTVLAVLAGGAVMMHLLTKPRVSILSLSPIHWFYIYEGCERKVGTTITINVKLLNSGSERTTINGAFITPDAQTFYTDRQIELGGHGTIQETIICLNSPSIISHGVKLQGTLVLEPWHNKRLFIGRKYLKRQIEVLEDEYNKGKS